MSENKEEHVTHRPLEELLNLLIGQIEELRAFYKSMDNKELDSYVDSWFDDIIRDLEFHINNVHNLKDLLLRHL